MSSEGSSSGVPDFVRTGGFGWRVGVSILIVFCWLAFLILWLFFCADEYGVFRNIAILLVSIIIGIGILSAIWASWGLRFAGQFKETEWRMDKPTLAWVTNTIAGIGWLLFLIVWLFYYADDYTGYQNLAIFITSLLVLGAVSGSIWMVRWFRPWRKHLHRIG